MSLLLYQAELRALVFVRTDDLLSIWVIKVASMGVDCMRFLAYLQSSC